MDEQPLIESWQINNRINLYLLEAIEEQYLSSALVSRGRTAGEQFAHINNVRLMWLKAAMPEAMETVEKVEKNEAHDKARLSRTLVSSGLAIEQLLRSAAVAGGRIKGFKPHATAFLAYLSAHDAHHRSQVIIALKQAGHHLDKKTLYGIWEWGTR